MRKTSKFEIEVNGEMKSFRASQLPATKALALQMKLQKDAAPLLFAVFQELDDAAKLSSVLADVLQRVPPTVLEVLLHDMIFTADVYQIEDKLLPLNESLFNTVFSGDLMACWELIVKVLLLNFESFILALPGKLQALMEKGGKMSLSTSTGGSGAS